MPKKTRPEDIHPRVVVAKELVAHDVDPDGDQARHLLRADQPLIVRRDDDPPLPHQRRVGNQLLDVRQDGEVRSELRPGVQLSDASELGPEAQLTEITRRYDLDTGEVSIERRDVSAAAPASPETGSGGEAGERPSTAERLAAPPETAGQLAAPDPTPLPVPARLPAPTPIPTPHPVPTAPVPAPIPASIPVPAPSPASIPVPAPIPASIPVPAPSPASIPPPPPPPGPIPVPTQPQTVRRSIRERLQGGAQRAGQVAAAGATGAGRGVAAAPGAARGAAASGFEGIAGGLEGLETGRAQAREAQDAQQGVAQAQQAVRALEQQRRESARPRTRAEGFRSTAARLRGEQLPVPEKTDAHIQAEKDLQEAEQNLASARAGAGSGISQRLGALTAKRQQPAKPAAAKGQKAPPAQGGGFNFQNLLKSLSAGGDTPARQPKGTGPKYPKGSRSKGSQDRDQGGSRGGQVTVVLRYADQPKKVSSAPKRARRRDDFWDMGF